MSEENRSNWTIQAWYNHTLKQLTDSEILNPECKDSDSLSIIVNEAVGKSTALLGMASAIICESCGFGDKQTNKLFKELHVVALDLLCLFDELREEKSENPEKELDSSS